MDTCIVDPTDVQIVRSLLLTPAEFRALRRLAVRASAKRLALARWSDDGGAVGRPGIRAGIDGNRPFASCKRISRAAYAARTPDRASDAGDGDISHGIVGGEVVIGPGMQVALSAGMINSSQIKPNTPVVCSNNTQFAVVDHMQGTDTIKLNKDAKGQHHYIPMSWVKSVDDKVHIDRPGDQAMREWTTTPKDKGPVAAPAAKA